MKFKEYCPIIEKKLYNNYLTLKIKTENIAKYSKAGQFINIRVSETLHPLLRRPFSIADIEDGIITIIILIKGIGTQILLNKQIGDKLNVIGPLGNCFILNDKKAIFAAGGIGIAPFLFLSRIKLGATLILGVKSKDFLPDLNDFSNRCEIKTSSEDGSVGQKGTVIDLIVQYDLTKYAVYACGPNPMLRALSKVLFSCRDADAYYSVETVFGCGFGACRGCAVETPGGEYKLACVDGPIFKWNEVLL